MADTQTRYRCYAPDGTLLLEIEVSSVVPAEQPGERPQVNGYAAMLDLLRTDTRNVPQIERLLRLRGVRVHRATIYRWLKSGQQLGEIMCDGEGQYRAEPSLSPSPGTVAVS